jgi:hypothetical protein
MAAGDPSFDVPTPRGVLRGVAAFSWDGSAWQPQGKAATEVPTPTGVLRGVAAFSGGPNWSPNTRAQTEVPTPSGVLDGVAVYTSGPAQAGVIRAAFGNDPWSLTTAFNGHVRRAMTWKRVLSDAEMQQVTS